MQMVCQNAAQGSFKPMKLFGYLLLFWRQGALSEKSPVFIEMRKFNVPKLLKEPMA